MAAVVASSPHGLMRGKLLVAWKRWHLRTARIKHVRRVAQLLRKRTNDQAEYRAWLAWRAHLKHRLALDRKHYRLAARCGGRTLRLHFTKWKAAAARRKALVPHIRERWLHLFSDPHHEQERSHPSNNINGSLPQCGPAPAVAAGAGRATGGSNRFRQSLNNLELQLLYWDDDDDDDGREGANGEPSSSGRAGTAGGNDGSGGSGATAAEEEEEGNDAGARAVEHALTHAVLLRRYVTRWRDRAWRASSLQLKASAVRRLSLRCCARSSFSVMLCLHGRAMLQKHKECQYFLSRNANGVEVTEQLALTGQNNEAAELHARSVPSIFHLLLCCTNFVSCASSLTDEPRSRLWREATRNSRGSSASWPTASRWTWPRGSSSWPARRAACKTPVRRSRHSKPRRPGWIGDWMT